MIAKWTWTNATDRYKKFILYLIGNNSVLQIIWQEVLNITTCEVIFSVAFNHCNSVGHFEKCNMYTLRKTILYTVIILFFKSLSVNFFINN
jgi:hypothetical protein